MNNSIVNILVLGMGSNVSQGIVKALRNIQDIHIHIVGACISKSSVGLYMCDEAMISPLASDPDFIPWYIDTCNRKAIDIVFTGVEENINTIVKNREKIEANCKAKYAYPTKEIWDVGYDKYETCRWLQKHNIPYPDYVLASDDLELAELITRVGFPLVAKPRSGKSSGGVIIADSFEQLSSVLGRNDYLIQEYIGNNDNEYTIGCYFTRNGSLVSRIIMHRYLKNGGTSVAEIENHKGISDVVNSITNSMFMTGPLNIQIRLRDDGTPVCFEWNVRYSGATAMRSHFGFCDVEAAIREYVFQENVSRCFNVSDSGVAIRMDEEIYFETVNLEELFLQKNR